MIDASIVGGSVEQVCVLWCCCLYAPASKRSEYVSMCVCRQRGVFYRDVDELLQSMSDLRFDLLPPDPNANVRSFVLFSISSLLVFQLTNWIAVHRAGCGRGTCSARLVGVDGVRRLPASSRSEGRRRFVRSILLSPLCLHNENERQGNFIDSRFKATTAGATTVTPLANLPVAASHNNAASAPPVIIAPSSSSSSPAAQTETYDRPRIVSVAHRTL